MAKQKKTVATEQIDCSLCINSFFADKKHYCVLKLQDISKLKDSGIVEMQDECRYYRKIK